MKKTYKLVVDSDVRGIDLSGLSDSIYSYLNDTHGWQKYGYSFEPVTHGEDILIRMSTPQTLDKLMGDRTLSCAELGGHLVNLNVYRWLYGSPASKLPLYSYRQYVVSHEIGHILGYQHVSIPSSGPCPIMVQQTLGIGNCIPNTSVLNLDIQSKKNQMIL